jgi:prepilin-type N-terminal cleavage/methylation domain-containing protein
MVVSNYKRNKNLKKGYSLIEVIISLAIMGFAITVMFSFLILSLQISTLSLARSFVREELSNVSGLIARDIRNADYIIGCGDSAENQQRCQVIQNGVTYVWEKCDSNGSAEGNEEEKTRICKLRLGVDGENSIMFISSQTLIIKLFEFNLGYTDGSSEAKTNIIFLINASHVKSNYNINNVVRQTSISTRNF